MPRLDGIRLTRESKQVFYHSELIFAQERGNAPSLAVAYKPRPIKGDDLLYGGAFRCARPIEMPASAKARGRLRRRFPSR